MATKLGLFNAALIEAGHRRLVDTGEPVEAGRVLNEIYPDVVKMCLERGFWNFAMETVKLTADTGIEPAFGFTEVFAKPSDWVRTAALSADERFTVPLTRAVDDASFLSADVSPVYMRYISNDTGLGFELSRWPSSFARYVALELAYRICPTVAASESMKERIGKDRKDAEKFSLNTDAMNEPQPQFQPPGNWVNSRSNANAFKDRGFRNRLTGG